MLTLRELNRATLAGQLLLEREAVPALTVLEPHANRYDVAFTT